jgi:hypothetical protein
VLVVLHYQDVVQPGKVQYGALRAWDLHFRDFIEVRLHSTEWVAVEHASDKQVFAARSDSYSKNVGITSDCKAMLLNTVAVGNGKKVTLVDTLLTQPPPGYDSVSILGLIFHALIRR